MAAFVVVGGLFIESAAAVLRAAAAVAEGAAAADTAGVDSEPFACSNDSSVFVDLSAVVLADVLVVHFITDEWQVDVDTLLELLLLLLLLMVAVEADSLLLLLVPDSAAALTSQVAAAEAVAFF